MLAKAATLAALLASAVALPLDTDRRALFQKHSAAATDAVMPTGMASALLDKDGQKGGNHLWFYLENDKATRGFNNRCGEVDAAPLMPASLFLPNNLLKLVAYAEATTKFYRTRDPRTPAGPTKPPGPELSVKLGRCADAGYLTRGTGGGDGGSLAQLKRLNGCSMNSPACTNRFAATTSALWIPNSLMGPTCASACNCNWPVGCQLATRKGELSGFCNLCGSAACPNVPGGCTNLFRNRVVVDLYYKACTTQTGATLPRYANFTEINAARKRSPKCFRFGPKNAISAIAAATPDLSTLNTALKAANLRRPKILPPPGTLSEDRSARVLEGVQKRDRNNYVFGIYRPKAAAPTDFTVFAPTNAAFGPLSYSGALATLLMPSNQAQLTKVLTYHVVAGNVQASDLKDNQRIKTVQGDFLTVRITNGDVFINSAKVITADVQATNGVVHIIDAVLTPPSADDESADEESSDHLVGGKGGVCSSDVSFRDTYGTCKTYVDNMWCAYGTVGPAWNAAWGTLGAAAAEACCACGGGSIPAH